MERPSDCTRWIEQGHAELVDGALLFTDSFFESQRRQAIESDPIGFDDGIARRWVTRKSGGIGVKQLVPVDEAGTDRHVTKNPDRLMRRQYRRVKPVIRTGEQN
jgi:hypothetical protein